MILCAPSSPRGFRCNAKSKETVVYCFNKILTAKNLPADKRSVAGRRIQAPNTCQLSPNFNHYPCHSLYFRNTLELFKLQTRQSKGKQNFTYLRLAPKTQRVLVGH